MENIPNDFINIFAKEGVKTNLPSDSFDLHMEWVKWLSYTSINEEDKKELLNLFKKYGTKNMDPKDYQKVLDYMTFNSLEDYMNSKLTKEELEEAKEKIEKYKNILNDELSDKVENEKIESNYMNMSMVDAYVLHYLYKIVIVRGSISLENDIKYSKIMHICRKEVLNIH